MTEDYQPVSCRLHSEIELYIMHRSTVNISIIDDKDTTITGVISDIKTRDKAEYMLITDKDANKLEIRLDCISQIIEKK